MKKLRIAQPPLIFKWYVGIYSVLNTLLKWAKNVEVKEIMVLEVVDQGIILDINQVIYIHVA